MTIKLCVNQSERNKIQKEITEIVTLTGVLKSSTSIIDPIILIEDDISNYVNCNYLLIEEFERSYFINDIVTIRNNLFEIHAHVDVITSFADSILENYGIIHRQEKDWNLYLDDGSFRVYQNPIVSIKEFSNGFNTLEYVLAIAGS